MQGLPPEAALWREDQGGWSQRDELIATLIEVVDAWGRQNVSALVAVHGGKAKLPEPLRIDHPGRPKPEPPPKERITASVGEIAEFFRRRI